MSLTSNSRFHLVSGVLFALLGTDGVQAAPKKAGDVVLEKVTATAADGKAIEFERGTLYVPENRGDPRSRLIGVGFARFRAVEDKGVPPTFHLPGGPGNSLLTGLEKSPSRLTQVARYQRISDVVIFDQRGFSERGDMLRFTGHLAAEPLDEPADISRSTATFVAGAKAAVAALTAKGVDLRGYTVIECADDVDDLRKALGYERITLVGTSFGSQWSFAVMRRHPEIVARALLSGIEPLDYGYDMPSHIFAAVERMWWQAEQDARLKPYIPPGGLIAAAKKVLRRLDREPVAVQLTDPQTKETTTVVLGRQDFQRDAFLQRTDGPAFVLSAYYKHYEAWAATVLARRKSRNFSMPLIGPLIDTSLGVTRKREYLLRNDPASELLGHWNFDAYLASAEVWPSEDVGDDFRTEVVSPIPVVFAQGDWDTQTPVENALYAAPYFPNGRVIIAEHGGHGVIGPLLDGVPQAARGMTEFLATGNTQDLPARVTLPVPRFSVPSFPPPTE